MQPVNRGSSASKSLIKGLFLTCRNIASHYKGSRAHGEKVSVSRSIWTETFLVQSSTRQLSPRYAASLAVHSSPSEPRHRSNTVQSQSEENISRTRSLRAAERSRHLRSTVDTGQQSLPSRVARGYWPHWPPWAPTGTVWTGCALYMCLRCAVVELCTLVQQLSIRLCSILRTV